MQPSFNPYARGPPAGATFVPFAPQQPPAQRYVPLSFAPFALLPAAARKCLAILRHQLSPLRLPLTHSRSRVSVLPPAASRSQCSSPPSLRPLPPHRLRTLTPLHLPPRPRSHRCPLRRTRQHSRHTLLRSRRRHKRRSPRLHLQLNRAYVLLAVPNALS